MGLDIYLYQGPMDEEGEGREFATTQVKSKRFPDQYSGPRYLRSSYNSGGFNNVVHNLIGEDLHTIFAPDTEAEYWCPSKDNLRAARVRAERCRTKLAAANFLRVATIPWRVLRPDLHGELDSQGAIAAYLKDGFEPHAHGSYSNSLGYFYRDEPLKVLAAIPGAGFLGPEIHLIYEGHDEWRQYYLDMCDVIVEFIDEALGMECPSIVWSG